MMKLDRISKLTLLVIAMLAVAAISSVGTMLWLWSVDQNETLPPMLENLPPSSPTSDAQLTRRLQARFPVGSPEKELVTRLGQDGFVASWTGAEEPQTFTYQGKTIRIRQPAFDPTAGEAYRHTKRICGMDAKVTWRSDAAGKLASVSGEFVQSTCF